MAIRDDARAAAPAEGQAEVGASDQQTDLRPDNCTSLRETAPDSLRAVARAAEYMDTGKALPRVVRVLVCDDNRDIADSVTDLLKFCGYEVVTCYHAAAALAAVDGGFRPDVCLLDLNMPGMAGDELAMLLRLRLPDSPPHMVAVTALSDEAAVSRIRCAGFNSHMVKPADPARLLAALSHLDG